MKRPVLIACVMVLSAPLDALAQAECPAGVARDGVWLGFSDRTVLTRVLSDGRLHEMEIAHDGSDIYTYITSSLGLVLEAWTLQNGQAPRAEYETVTFVGTPDPMPDPVSGARFDGIATSRYGDGTEVRATVNVVVGQPQPVTIGGCSYTGLPVDVTRVEFGGGVPQRDGMMHLTELGLTIYLGFAEGDAAPSMDLPLSISLAPPEQVSAGTLAPPLPPVGGAPAEPEK